MPLLPALLPFQQIVHDMIKTPDRQRHAVDQLQLFFLWKSEDFILRHAVVLQPAVSLYLLVVRQDGGKTPDKSSCAGILRQSVQLLKKRNNIRTPDLYGSIHACFPGCLLQKEQIRHFQFLLPNRIVMKQTAIVFTELQKKLLEVIHAVVALFHRFADFVVLLQNPLQADPVGPVLPVFVLFLCGKGLILHHCSLIMR